MLLLLVAGSGGISQCTSKGCQHGQKPASRGCALLAHSRLSHGDHRHYAEWLPAVGQPVIQNGSRVRLREPFFYMVSEDLG